MPGKLSKNEFSDWSPKKFGLIEKHNMGDFEKVLQGEIYWSTFNIGWDQSSICKESIQSSKSKVYGYIENHDEKNFPKMQQFVFTMEWRKKCFHVSWKNKNG